jgi:hypothetical protein
MASAEGRKDQDRPSLLLLDAEDHAEPAIRRREPELHAVAERGAIRSLLVAGKEVSNRNSFYFELLASRKRHLFPNLARPPQVLSEGSIIEQRRCASRPLVAHRLPLAVGGLNRAVLGFKVSQRPRLGPEALSDRLE